MTKPASRPLAEQTALGLLACAAVVAPLALGSSSIGARFVLELTMATAVILWTVSGKRNKFSLAIPLLIAAVSCIQLIPLPDRILIGLAPVSAGAWKVATGGLAAAWAPASVDPAAALIAIRRLLLGVATLVATADMCRYQSHRRRLTAALAVSGILILALGLIFGKAVGDKYLLLGSIPLAGPIYKHVNPIIMPVQSSGAGLPQQVAAGGHRYVMDAGSVGDGFGPYIYSNHFAGAIVLTIPIVLAAWLFVTYGWLPDLVRYTCCAALGGAAAFAVGAMANSRGGAAAFIAALLALTMLIVQRPTLRYLTSAAFIVMVAGIALLAGLLAYGGDHSWMLQLFPDSMQSVAKSLLNDTRTIPAQVALRMFFAAPLLGTGLNSYQSIFPRFYRGDFTLFYAHSDYAQFVAETGLIGISLLGAGCWVMSRKLFRFWKDAPEPYRLLAAGPWASLLGFAVHSAFDWNLHLPANAFLAIMICGLALSSVPAERRREDVIPISEPVLKYALVAFCLLATVLLGRDSLSEYAQRELRQAIVRDRLAKSESDKSASGAGFNVAISTGQRLAAWDPANSQLATLLSNAYLHAADRSEGDAERDKMLGLSDRWATRARRAAATARGLPERIPAS